MTEGTKAKGTVMERKEIRGTVADIEKVTIRDREDTLKGDKERTVTEKEKTEITEVIYRKVTKIEKVPETKLEATLTEAKTTTAGRGGRDQDNNVRDTESNIR